jgi:hypothetical protein
MNRWRSTTLRTPQMCARSVQSPAEFLSQDSTTHDPMTFGFLGLRLDCVVPCCEGTRDEDRYKSSDMFQECDEASQLDELDGSTHFTFLKCFLHPTTILTKMMHEKRT